MSLFFFSCLPLLLPPPYSRLSFGLGQGAVICFFNFHSCPHTLSTALMVILQFKLHPITLLHNILLKWLPITHRIQCKLLTIACKVLYEVAPVYLYIHVFIQTFSKYLQVPTMFRVNKTDKNPCPDIWIEDRQTTNNTKR